MTDMSPAAIKDRLHTMDELWLLSVKLMDAKVIERSGEEDFDVTPGETAEDASQNRER